MFLTEADSNSSPKPRGELVPFFPMEIRARIQILHQAGFDGFPKDLERAASVNAEILEKILQVARGRISAAEEADGQKREFFLPGRRFGCG